MQKGTTKQISIWFEKSDLEQLAKVAKASKMKRNDLLRMAVKQLIEGK